MGDDGDGHRGPSEFHDRAIEDTNVAKEHTTSGGKSTSGLNVRAPKGGQQAVLRRVPIHRITLLDQRLSHISATFQCQSAGAAAHLFEAEAMSLRSVLADDDS